MSEDRVFEEVKKKTHFPVLMTPDALVYCSRNCEKDPKRCMIRVGQGGGCQLYGGRSRVGNNIGVGLVEEGLGPENGHLQRKNTWLTISRTQGERLGSTITVNNTRGD